MMLAENLAVLARKAPDLAAAIADRDGQGIELRTAADGSQLAFVRGVPLHNVHDPVGEARRWAAAWLAGRDAPRGQPDGDSDRVLLVPGFGAGHHLAALAAVTSCAIHVVEPNLDLLHAVLAGVDVRALLDRVVLRASVPTRAELEAMGRVGLCVFSPALTSDRDRLGGLRAAVQGWLGCRDLRLRILVVSPFHGGSLPLAGHASRALAALGHTVTFLDMSPFDAGFRHLGELGSETGLAAIRGRFVDVLADGIVERAQRQEVDLVLALAQAPLTAAALDRLANADIRTALWFVEDFRRFPYWREVAPSYDHVFCIQRDECLEAFTAAGVRPTYLPCAADPALHRARTPTAAERTRWGSAVSFVGAGYRNRRVAFRRLLDLELKVWGTEWEGAEGLWGQVVQEGGRRLSAEESVHVFNASTINVNLHSSTYVDGVDPRGDFVNPRTFELAACGAFQLVDDRRLLPELFVPGLEIATFASVTELRERIAYYLARPGERAALAEAGRRRVLAEHTYGARMAQMLEAICAVDYPRLRGRWTASRGVDALVAAAGPETPLGRHLARTCGTLRAVTLDDIASHIHNGEGPLGEEEEILLFLKQFDDLFLAGERA